MKRVPRAGTAPPRPGRRRPRLPRSADASSRSMKAPGGNRTSVLRTSRPGFERSSRPSSCRFEPRGHEAGRFGVEQRPPSRPRAVHHPDRLPGSRRPRHRKGRTRRRRRQAVSIAGCHARARAAEDSAPSVDGDRWPGSGSERRRSSGPPRSGPRRMVAGDAVRSLVAPAGSK